MIIVTIGEKILVELNKQGKSQKSLAKYVGVSDTAIGKWKNKPQDIKFENVVKASEFLNVSLNYLAYGKEPSIPREYQKLISTYKTLSPDNQNMALGVLEAMYDVQCRNNIECITIKHSIYKVSAGKGYSLDDEDWEEINVIRTSESEQADFAVTVDGDSMLPDYKDGDIVLVKQQDTIELGQIGIFTMNNNQGFIKESGVNCLISHNPEYDDIVPTENDIIECNGLVLGKAILV